MSNVFYDELGPLARRRVARSTYAVSAGLILLAAFCLYKLYGLGQLSPRIWSVLLEADFLFLLMNGLQATLKAAWVALVLSLGFGGIIAIGLISRSPAIRLPLRVWTEVFRGLPLLLLIFFIYLGAPAVGIEVTSFWSLVIGISLYNSAVFAEIIRAGIMSLPKGQREAGLVIGLTSSQTLRMILMPQAIRRMLPTMLSQTVVLLKETSLGFIVGYTELLREGRTAVEYLGGEYSLPVYTALAAIYIVLCLFVSMLAVWFEKRLSKR